MNGHLTTLIKHRLRHMYVNKVLSLAYFQFQNVLDHGISRYFKISLLIQSQSFIRYSGKMLHACQKNDSRFASLHSVLKRSEKWQSLNISIKISYTEFFFIRIHKKNTDMFNYYKTSGVCLIYIQYCFVSVK